MTNRRDFLKKTSLIVVGGVMGGSILSSCSSAKSISATAANTPKKHIGLQLYSLRDDVKNMGIKKVLKIVAGMGYVNLETAGYADGKIYGIAPAKFKKMVDDLGMKVTSAHLGRNLSDNRDDDLAWWKKAVEAHAAAGLKYMIMAWAPLKDLKDATMDNAKKYSDYFNSIGEIVAAANISFGYHNHNFEFENKIDGTPLYDLLLKNTNPDHVMFENDVYWCQKGGGNPIEYMKKYPQRIRLLHIKDETVIGASGTIDFKAIFNQAYTNNINDWYVEVERYDGTPQGDVKKSYDFLAAADFVK